MSSQTIRNRITNLQREIQSLQRQLTNASKDVAAKSGRIAQIRRSITKGTSPSMFQSKQRDIQHLEDDLVRIQDKQAVLNKRISDKTAELHKYEQQLYTEQQKEQKKLVESLKRKEQEEKARQAQLLAKIQSAPREMESRSGLVRASSQEAIHDAFISHASEDKDDLVRPLAEALQRNGCLIWYDEFQLRVGDSLRRSIDKGLARSRFGIVVLSPAFFAKNWTQYELDGLVAKEMTGGKVILPIWHKVSKDEVMSYSPSLADKFALSTAMYTVEELAKALGEVLRGA